MSDLYIEEMLGCVLQISFMDIKKTFYVMTAFDIYIKTSSAPHLPVKVKDQFGSPQSSDSL